VRIVLELERIGTTIRGQLAVGDAAEGEFFGWLELIGRLERAVHSLEPGLEVATKDAS
jgi:hypothetical protein